MNNIRIVELIAASAFAAAFVFTGCAKSEKTLPFEDEERYVEAWVSQRHPEATKTELGIYIYWTTKPVTAKSSTRRNS